MVLQAQKKKREKPFIVLILASLDKYNTVKLAQS